MKTKDSFTTSCFINRNTPELREYLERVGYRKGTCTFDECEFLITSIESSNFFTLDWYPVFEDDEDINCTDNEPLFKAIAALRDDNDYMQWFVIDEDVFETFGWRKGSFQLCNDGCYFTTSIARHKATVKELQEHFKQ